MRISVILAFNPCSTKIRINKAQQRLHFLRIRSFYHCSVKSILTYCICVWFSSCTAAERKALQRIITTAQKVIGCPLPSMEELNSSSCLLKAQKILKDPSHPGHSLFATSGRRYRVLKTRTNKLRNSFYAKAISVLNTVKM